jgi:SAM-dependent methyltransferase
VKEAEPERIRREYHKRAATLPAEYYAWHREENQYFQTSARRAVTRLLSRAGVFPLTHTSIADIGCGHGQWLLEFLQWGAAAANLHGIDLIEDRIAYARERIAGADLRTGDACHLPWPDRSMGLVAQFTVMSSLLDPAARAQLASEMIRVTRRGGYVLWYDMRRSNPANSAVKGVAAAEIRTLFPGCAIQFAPATLAPPIARAVIRFSWAAAFALETMAPACTHLAALIRID